MSSFRSQKWVWNCCWCNWSPIGCYSEVKVTEYGSEEASNLWCQTRTPKQCHLPITVVAVIYVGEYSWESAMYWGYIGTPVYKHCQEQWPICCVCMLYSVTNAGRLKLSDCSLVLVLASNPGRSKKKKNGLVSTVCARATIPRKTWGSGLIRVCL